MESEQYGDVEAIKKWKQFNLLERHDCVTFAPEEGEIAGFAGFVGSDLDYYVEDEELQVYRPKDLWKFEWNSDFIEQTRRDVRASRSKVSVNPDIVSVTTNGTLFWIGTDEDLLDAGKEYLCLVFDELLKSIGPAFELHPTKHGRNELVAVTKVKSPWDAINLSLFNYFSGRTALRKCRNPSCDVIDDKWARQRHYCSEACQKVCERNGLKLRSNSKRKN